MKIIPFLAEIVPQGGAYWDYSRPPDGMIAAIILFLLLMCLGVALDVGLFVYFMKRPSRPAEWGAALAQRALPGRLVLLLTGMLTAGYLGFSMLYAWMKPDVVEVEPATLIAQGVLFHLPALVLLLGAFVYRRISVKEPVFSSGRWVPGLLGLSVLLYLATFPLLWFYSVLYQTFLHQLGCSLYLQEVAQVFLMPAPAWQRAGMYFVAIVSAPVVEECFFRGLLFPWLVKRAGLWPAVALVSVVFASMHMHVPSFLPLFLLSSTFCIAYARTRSLLVPIGMHACFNGVSVLLLSLTG